MHQPSPFRFEAILHHDDAIPANHAVHGVRILPGVTFLDAFCRVLLAEGFALGELELRNVLFQEPVATTEAYDKVIEVSLEPGLERIVLRGRSRRIKDGRRDGDWTDNVVCEVHSADAAAPPALDLEALRARATRAVDFAQVYGEARHVGIEHGDFMRAHGCVHTDGRFLLAELGLGPQALESREDFHIHAAHLDAATFVPFLLAPGVLFHEHAYIPIHIDCFRAYGATGERCWAYVPQAAGVSDADVLYGSYAVFDAHGRPAYAVQRLAVKRVRDLGSIRRLVEDHAPGVSAGQGVGVAARPAIPPAEEAASTELEIELRSLAGDVLGVAPDEIDMELGFYDQGFDSTHLVRLVRRLESRLGRALYPTLLFEYPTIRQLAHHLEAAARESGQPLAPPPAAVRSSAPAVVAPAPRGEAEVSPVAIVGLAGRYPMAPTLQAFWRNLADGRDCITELPRDRWDSCPAGWGAFLQGIDRFDPLLFGISPREAELRDPQERLFLEVVWEALEDAGYTRASLSRQRVGVFAGVMWLQYQLLAGDGVFPESIGASIANRVSYVFDLHGPSLAVDTMCSSSLTALHLACESLRRGECEAAIAGGVNLAVHPNKYLQLAQGRLLSSDGRCRSFGEGGDGYVPGEGVGAVLLKPLSRALADGDHIHGVIKGTAVNHGGRTSGYTVPSPHAQGAAIAEALSRSGVDARTVSYVEAHGTGTSLGDPIEVAGLAKAYGEWTQARQYCAIGSVKSNIGHLESAAGIAGVTKVLLQMRYGQLVPSLHSGRVNPNIAFEDSPFRVQRELVAWERPQVEGRTWPRRAGVSSFGAGGSNAHVVLEEYEAQAASQAGDGAPQLVVLSARSEPQLREVAERLGAALADAAVRRVSLADVAHTLQVGREPMDWRAAIVARSIDELRALLPTVFDEAGRDGAVQRGSARARRTGLDAAPPGERERVNRAVLEGRWQDVARAWVSGAEVDWSAWRDGAARRRVPLPTYPFARERYWVASSTRAGGAAAATVDVLHPLVHRNTSTLEGQSFQTTLPADSPFVSGHAVAGRPVVPAAVYVEMARAGGDFSRRGARVRALRDVKFVRPLWPGATATQLRLQLAPVEGGAVCSITSGDEAGPEHARAVLEFEHGPGLAPERLGLDRIRAACGEEQAAEACYSRFAAAGLEYGGSWRTLLGLAWSVDEALARVALPEPLRTGAGAFLLHPSLLDAALQAVAALTSFARSGAGSLLLPASIDRIDIWSDMPAECVVHVRAQGSTGTTGGRSFDIRILDVAGHELVRLTGCAFEPAPSVERASTGRTLFFRSEYREAPLTRGGRVTGPVLLLADSLPVWQRWRELDPEGADGVSVATPGESYREIRALNYEVRPGEADDFARLLASLAERRLFPAAIVRFASFGSANASRWQRAFDPVFALSRALLEVRLEQAIQLLHVFTRREGEPTPAADAAVCAFARSVRQESSKLGWRTVELVLGSDEPALSRAAEGALQELAEGAPEDLEVRRAGGRRHLSCFAELAWQPEVDGVSLRDGTYLVSGGAGGIGLLLAEQLAGVQGARLLLLGRGELGEERRRRLERIDRTGGAVHYLRGDVRSIEDVRRAVAWVRERWGRLTGVIHAAGLVRDRLLKSKPLLEAHDVIGGKVDGAWALDEATCAEPLDFFALFSSTTGLLGNLGQCDYAYANAHLWWWAEEREQRRRKGERSGRTLALAWPLWAAGGMNVDESTRTLLYATMGMQPLPADEGLAAFRRAVAGSDARLMVVHGHAERLRKALRVPPAQASDTTQPPSGGEGQADDPLRTRVQAELVEIVSRLLKIPASAIDPAETFSDYGFDSIALTELANQVNERYGSDLTPPVFFEHSSLLALARHLRRHYGALVERATGEAASEPAAAMDAARPGDRRLAAAVQQPAAPSVAHRCAHCEPIAVVGMSGVMPGSSDLEEFWGHLVAGRDLVTEVPGERWDWRAGSGERWSRWGGFMKEVDRFDAAFFGISPREAALMDPQQRIVLQAVWGAIEDAGYRASDLRGSATGLFVGVSSFDYAELLRERGVGVEAYSSTGIAHSVLANRVSYVLDLRGPSEPVDTACSSSLVAVHRAVEAIRSGGCELALAGGVNVMLTPTLHMAFGKAGMLSEGGRCRTFDASANGYVRGEGAGVVLLKRLSRAEADGDRICGVIVGTAVNHGGHANSLTAPNPNAQSELLVRAYGQAGIDPRTVGYIEAHGTGTKLGDPVEVNALKKAFGELYRQWGVEGKGEAHCGLGSVKTNVGHLEAAAGIAGLLKVLLSLRHGVLPASLHCVQVNPYVDLEGSPFRLVRETSAWEVLCDGEGRVLPRRAGVSSFGFGGANAHVVLEEYRTPALPMGRADTDVLVVLSAKDEEALRASAENLRAVMGREAGPQPPLRDLAYTLQVGREALTERLALVASTPGQLVDSLARFLARDPAAPVLRGRADAEASPARVVPDRVSDSAGLVAVARAWVSGADIAWSALHGAGPDRPRKLSLPSYPFRRTRHWVDTYQRHQQAGELAALAPPSAPEFDADAVVLEVMPGGVAVVRMQDRRNRNMLSADILHGLAARLEEAGRRSDVLAVVVTGDERVFNMGGTAETLRAMTNGEARCSDWPFVYQGFLSCELPIVAAMQGHAQGGGLVLGLYADVVVMALDATYGANFTTLGFTPGMGATWVLERKLGPNLATEMMFSGRSFSGEELQRRGASVVFREGNEVLSEAVLIARSFAEKPRHTLRVLKRTLAGEALAHLPSVIASEVAMHDQTVTRPEVKARVEEYFARPAAFSEAGTPTPHADPVAAKPTLRPVAGVKIRLKGHAVAAPAPPTPASEGRFDDGPDEPAVMSETATAAQVAAVVGHILHTDAATIDPQASLRDLGLDSIGAVEVMRDLNKVFGLRLETTALYDHPSLTRLARFVSQKLGEAGIRARASCPTAPPVPTVVTAGAARPEAAPAPAATSVSADVAVIGMSGRFPGAADVDEFWANLCRGVDSISAVPPDRWDPGFYDPDPKAANRSYSRWGGFLKDIDRFDARFFNLLPADAERIDPQHRLFLEEAWRALEDAGYAPARLARWRCGVFAGVSAGDYATHLKAAGCEADGRTLLGSIASTLPARVSYLLDLRGPAVAVDTACSSSLVAVHQACQSLLARESDLALAGGVCVMTTPEMYLMTSKAGMLSPSGRCRPFDDSADGITLAEAVGVLVLKRLDDARRDRDHIHGVIRASGVNNDGRSNGMTAPTMEAQADLVREVHRRAGVDAAALGYVEAHGTGTRLGDPIELTALGTVLGTGSGRPCSCAIGSVKGNIGHALSAAGIAGLIKVLLCLRHGALVPSLHFDVPNSHFDFTGSPFYVNTRLQPWESHDGKARIGAVSSFGLSGTNCHLVLAEEPQEAPLVAAEEPQLLALSARTEGALADAVSRLRAFLERSDRPPLGLRDVAYTLAVGRVPFEERLAIVAADTAGAVEALAGFLRGDAPEGVFRGRARSRNGAPAIGDQTLAELASAWATGEVDDLTPVFASAPGRRVPLPTYSFAAVRCWLDRPTHAASDGDRRSVLHPLVHANASRLGQTRYTTSLSGADAWLADHVIRGRRTLPGVCSLEMARAAAEFAGAGEVRGVRAVVWSRPLILSEGEAEDLHIELRESRGRLAFEVATGEGDGPRRSHVRGLVDTSAAEVEAATLDLDTLRARLRPVTDGAAFYAAFEEADCRYGPSLRLIERVHCAGGEALADLAPDQGASAYGWSPAALEAALQTTIAVLRGAGVHPGRAYVPFSLDRLIVRGSPSGARHARAVQRGSEATQVACFDVELLNSSGAVLVAIDNLVLKPALEAARAPEDTLALLELLRDGRLEVDEVEQMLAEAE